MKGIFYVTVLFAASAGTSQDVPAGQPLTWERIFGEQRLTEHVLRPVWSPNSKQIAYLLRHLGMSKERNELWTIDTATGVRRLLLSSERMNSMLREANSAGSELASHEFQFKWFPNGTDLLLSTNSALMRLDSKTSSVYKMISGGEDITDPQASPDGQSVSFLRSHNLWIVDIANLKLRSLTSGGTEELRKGETDWLYTREFSVRSGYNWAPDSSAIAYRETDERRVPKRRLLTAGTDGVQSTYERYPRAGESNPIVRIFVVSINGSSTRSLQVGTEDDCYFPILKWLPDSRRLAVGRLNREQTKLDLLVADTKTGKAETFLTEKDPYWINIHDDLCFLHDGRHFIWSSERTGYRHLYLYEFGSRSNIAISSGTWEVTEVSAVDERRSLVYFIGTEKSSIERQLYRVAFDGSGLRRITSEEGWHQATFAPDNLTYIDSHSTAMTLPREDIVTANGEPISSLAGSNADLPNTPQLSPVEFLTVKTHDNVYLNASIIKPKAFDGAGPFPVIVFVYGGPHGQVVRDAWGGDVFLWSEMMAQRGFVTFAVDTRGTAGRGHLFEEPIHYRFGAQEVSDLRDAVAYLRKLAFADSHHVGICGEGYGGQIVLHAMFEDPGDFKVGFAESPITDWLQYSSAFPERYLGRPVGHREEYEESSPLQNVAQLRGKLLVAANPGDKSVPFENVLELTGAMVDSKKYIEIMLLPSSGEGIADPAARLMMFRRVTELFETGLSTTPPSRASRNPDRPPA